MALLLISWVISAGPAALSTVNVMPASPARFCLSPSSHPPVVPVAVVDSPAVVPVVVVVAPAVVPAVDPVVVVVAPAVVPLVVVVVIRFVVTGGPETFFNKKH